MRRRLEGLAPLNQRHSSSGLSCRRFGLWLSDFDFDLIAVLKYREAANWVHILWADGGAIGDIERNPMQGTGKRCASQRSCGHRSAGVGADIVDGMELTVHVAKCDALPADIIGAL